MANSTFGPGGKTGTVYDGPAPARGGTVYSGPTPAQAGGTVYNGPAPGGAGYNGPAAGAATMQQPTARQSAAPNVGAAKGANIFFLIAAFTGIRPEHDSGERRALEHHSCSECIGGRRFRDVGNFR